MRTLIVIGIGLLLGGWVEPPAEATGPGRVLEIRMVDKGSNQWRFEPAEVQVSAGDTVRFVMADVVPHNVEFRDMPDGADLGPMRMGPFLLQKGATYEIGIDDRFVPGVYKYVCTPHEVVGMVGAMKVTAGG